MPYLRALAFLAVMAVAFLFLVPLQALARRRGWAIQHVIQTGFCRVICAVIGIRVEARNALPAMRPRFVVSNHVSWTDIIALASIADESLHLTLRFDAADCGLSQNTRAWRIDEADRKPLGEIQAGRPIEVDLPARGACLIEFSLGDEQHDLALIPGQVTRIERQGFIGGIVRHRPGQFDGAKAQPALLREPLDAVLVHRAMEKDPARRYQNMGEILQDLRRVATTLQNP